MASTLNRLDDDLAETRDKERYMVEGRGPLSRETLLGEVRVDRRYYRDRRTGERVFLLDEHLKLEGGRMSPGLLSLAVRAGAEMAGRRSRRCCLWKRTGYK